MIVGVRGLVLLLASCVAPSTVECGGQGRAGLVCPAGRVCAPRNDACVLPEQVSACAGLPEDQDCTFAGASGTCRDQFCVGHTCGNGVIDPGEDCDGSPPAGKTCLDFGYDVGLTTACTSSCTADLSPCSRLGWTPVAVTTEVHYLYGIWGTAADDILVAGDIQATCNFANACEGLLHYDGSTWTRLLLPPDFFGVTNAVWASAPNDIFVSSGNLLYHFDGTASGTLQTLDRNVRAISGTARDNVFAVGDGGLVERFDGNQWLPIPSPTTATLHGAWATGSKLYVAGDAGSFLRWDGSNWQSLSSPQPQALRAVWGFADNDVFAVGDDGKIFHYDGLVTAYMPSGTTNALLAVWGASRDDVFVSGANGTVLYLDGTRWVPLVTNSSDTLVGLWGSTAGDLLAVGTSGTVLRFSGLGWSPIVSGTPGDFSGIWAATRSDAFAVGDNGLIMKLDGASATRMISGTNQHLGDVGGTSASNVYAVGAQGVVLHYNGSVWQATPSPNPRVDWSSVWATGSEVFVVGSPLDPTADPNVLHFDGATWTTASAPAPPGVLYSVWGRAANDVYAIGVRSLVHFDGSSWLADTGITAAIGEHDNFSQISGSGAELFIVGRAPVTLGGADEPLILHFDGKQWSRMAAPASTRLVDVFANAVDDVFAVGLNRTLLHFDGTAWTPVRRDPLSPSDTGPVSGAERQFIFGGNSGSLLRLIRATGATL
jgi:hypothetical protein